MKWNRPNGGYETEPWRNTRITQMELPKIKNTLGKHSKHSAIVTGPKGPHAGGLYCTECKCLIRWLSPMEYNTYKEIKNGKV